MNSIELHKEMNMEYDELTAYLQQKYNKPARAFFCNSECRTEAKDIKRAKEGLCIHHIKEIEVDNLQDKEQAKTNPWEYQEPQNLCYCNYLEHLILHIKINIVRTKNNNILVFDGVLNYLIPDLNYIYTNNPVETAKNRLWRNSVKELIIDNYADYQDIIQMWIDNVYNYTWGNRLTVNKVLKWQGFSTHKPTITQALTDFSRHFLRKE